MPIVTPTLLEGLNPAQREAVTAGDGPLLIVAGPGSGKTRVLTHRIAYLLQEHRVAPWRICAVTFTNKAARELRERLDNLVGVAGRDLAVGTFHGLCARFLRQYGDEVGLPRDFTIYDDDDQDRIVKLALKVLGLDPKQVTPRSMLSAISAAKSADVSPEDFARGASNYREEVIGRVYARYQALLIQNGGVDFDDLLGKARDLLALPTGRAAQQLPERFRHVLVDEYQDTNAVQFDLVRRLSAVHGNLSIVGDPDQAIYAWRGATIRNILDFERHFPKAQVIRLEQNYRSTRRILAVADAVITLNEDRHAKTLWTENAEGEAVTIAERRDELDEADSVVHEIRSLVDRQGYRLSDIAVLYRTNAQSQPLEQACARYGVAYQLIGGQKFYERREIKDALALLRLVVNPRDDIGLRRVMDAMPVAEGIGEKSWQYLNEWASAGGRAVGEALQAWLDETIAAPPLTGKAGRNTRALAEMLGMLRTRRAQVDLVTLFDEALTASGYANLLREGSEPERWENLQGLRTQLQHYTNLPLEEQLSTFLEEAALVAAVDDLDPHRERLTLITLHAAKGLEFSVVFIVGLEEGLLPHSRSLDDPKAIEEERRLAFVGITRARERLYLSHAVRRGGYAPSMYAYGGPTMQARSRFLEDIVAKVAPPRPRPGRPERPGQTTASAPRRPEPARSTWSAADPAAQPEEVVVAVGPGDAVRHARFGLGRVVSVTPTRGDIEVTVQFAEHGQKRLMASMARLAKA